MEEYKSRVAVYLRKSRADNPDETIDETLTRHQNILMEYAVKQDITIIAVYKEVVSGDGLFTRPEMIRLLNDVENGLYTAVMCVDIDRLGRSSTKDSGIIMETLKDAGCLIITPEKTYNLEDDVDEMTVELKTFFARQELKSIRKRLRRGMEEAMKQGAHVGDIPYGYKRTWIGKLPTLEPIPETSAVVKMIYDWYTDEGIGSHTIAARLTRLGYAAPSGGNFSRSSVRMILHNPIYKGAIVWNKKHVVRKRKPGDKWREVENDESKWIVAKGLHEPIISEEQFEEAQRILESRKPKTRFTGIVRNPFSGLIYCANCGTAITRQVDRTQTERMYCTKTGCTRSVKLSELEEVVKEQLHEFLTELRMKPNATPKPKTERLKEQRKTIEKQLTTIRNQRSRLHDLLEQGVYTVDTFMERQRELTERELVAEKEIKEIDKKLNTKNKPEEQINLIPTIEEVLSKWDYLNPTDKNKLLKRIIDRMEYHREGTKHGTPFDLSVRWRI